MVLEISQWSPTADHFDYSSVPSDEMQDTTPRTKKRNTAKTEHDDEIEDIDVDKAPRALLIPSRPATSPSSLPTKLSVSIRSASL
ncbi:Uncharacterized protein HZ326_17440 [Fusarium oxysporum f. sp. albedinis]|nr:Uncharacterized protein HZ326_17440 [Fusarium oxysporum f. sp. albedinis]